MKSIVEKLTAALKTLTPEERADVEQNGRHSVHGYGVVVCVITAVEYDKLPDAWTKEARAKGESEHGKHL